jgi:hypothetical protein
MSNRTPRLMPILLAFSVILAPPLVAGQDDPVRIQVADGQLLFEFAGQVTNPTPTTSIQYGYFTYVEGVDTLFTGSPENEATALLTFFREATNVRVVADGPLRVISREGTTTIYLNFAPASFASPDSFRSGTPVLTSTFQQQVVLDTMTSVFTVVNLEEITDTEPFTLGGRSWVIGEPGNHYRTTKQGRANSPAPPAGFFAGYSVGVSSRGSHPSTDRGLMQVE